MNKIIKDLKERNDKLLEQYRLRDIRCVCLEQENDRLQKKVEQLEKELTIMVEDDERSQETIIKQSKRIEQLENIRKEAIEYIENNWITYNDSKDFTEFNEELPVFIKEINILLNILNKGSNHLSK